MGDNTVRNSSQEYFAAVEDPIQLANGMLDKIRQWRKWCEGRGLMSLWSKKLSNYYGTSQSGNTSQAVTKGGSEGELNMIKINDLHSLLQDQLVTVTSQRPAGIAKAINSDTKALKAATIGTAIAEYYMTALGFEAKFVQTAETALLCDEAFVDLFWDKSAGDPVAVDPETGQPEMSGDPVLRTHASWNVARDPGAKIDDIKWHIISFRVNKFDAAAQYPKFANSIINAKDDDLPSVPMNGIPEGSDMIWAHLLVHDRTAAIKKGRYSLLLAGNITLDSKLPYRDYPIERMAPGDVIDGCIGYAPSTDIMAAEEVTDALHSIIVTNQVNFGGQSIVGPEGSNLKHTDLAKGLRYFELPLNMVDKIRPLQLTQTPAEVFNYIQVLGQKKEKAVGSVSGILAQQAAQGASGNSMALIQTQAISYNSGTQRSYFKLLSGTMTKLISVLRTYADTPRIARIVGKSKAAGLKEFKYTGEDLDSVSSIVYELVNPVMQTFGGRLTMGETLMKAGQIKSPKQYINFVATGQLEVLTQDDEADGILILEENEALIEGRPVAAVITEMHADHMKSHNSLITQEAKERDPNLVGRVTEHVMEHIRLWAQASMSNPAILFATGQQPLPMAPPPGMMPPGAPPVGAPKGPQRIAGGAPPVVAKAEEVKEPDLPNVAGTKEKPQVPGVPAIA